MKSNLNNPSLDTQQDVMESRERAETTLKELVPLMYQSVKDIFRFMDLIETEILPHTKRCFRKQAEEGVLAFHYTWKMWLHPSAAQWSIPCAVHVSAHHEAQIDNPLVRIIAYLPKPGDTFYPFFFSSNGVFDIFSSHFFIRNAKRIKRRKGEPKSPWVYGYNKLPELSWAQMSEQERQVYYKNLDDLDILMGRYIGHSWHAFTGRDKAVLSKNMQQFGEDDMWYTVTNEGVSYHITREFEIAEKTIRVHYHNTFMNLQDLGDDQLRPLVPKISDLLYLNHKDNPQLYPPFPSEEQFKYLQHLHALNPAEYADPTDTFINLLKKKQQ